MENVLKLFDHKDKTGFTLSEILITLGIIGVIAAVTIPSLVQGVQDAQFKQHGKRLTLIFHK